MDERESIGKTPSHAAPREAVNTTTTAGNSPSDTGTFLSANEDLLSGTGSIPMAASVAGAASDEADMPVVAGTAPAPERSTARSSSKPRYVRKRTPHRSQGTLDALDDQELSESGYTHDSNIAVGGSTPLSGMAYRRSRNNMSRVRNGSPYGQYLEIPKGRRSIFASRERARRRRSVLALLAVITLLVFAAMFIWNMMQNLLG